jgi:NADH-quinone oxidoreductase subunit A
MLLAQEYIPILVLLALALVVPIAMVGMASMACRRKRTPAKLMTFECGNDPVGSPRSRFSVQFFLVALLFIIFDVEVVFIFPWAVLFRKLGLYGFVEMAVFIFILVLGLFYVWKKGALEWE